jgi:hypothetical protein
VSVTYYNVVFIYIDAAGRAEVCPLLEEGPVLIEDLDADVALVSDDDAALGIHGDGVRVGELSGCRPRAGYAPAENESAVTRELHHTVVTALAVAV